MGVSGEISSVDSYRGALVFRSRTFPGMALGGMVILHEAYPDEWIAHEFGHLQQEKQLGALYIPLVGLVSVGGNLINMVFGYSDRSYLDRWPENWAAILAL